MKYKEAMQQPDKDKWENAVEEEHDRMIKNEVMDSSAQSGSA
jgi:hypothetical protein